MLKILKGVKNNLSVATHTHAHTHPCMNVTFSIYMPIGCANKQQEKNIMHFNKFNEFEIIDWPSLTQILLTANRKECEQEKSSELYMRYIQGEGGGGSMSSEYSLYIERISDDFNIRS